MEIETQYRIGTAGWNVPPDYRHLFPAEGSHLERYAQVFNGVEINSSFYRHHKWQTYARWAETVPDDFQFSVKLFKAITHTAKLAVSRADLVAALEGPSALQEKWGVLLIQLPPSFQFDAPIADAFFDQLRGIYLGAVALEPRHETWTSDPARGLLRDYGISTVAADPTRIGDLDREQTDAGGFRYLRLHGSPAIYKSTYTEAALDKYAKEDLSHDGPLVRWCIFDNTTFGHSAQNGIDLQKRLS